MTRDPWCGIRDPAVGGWGWLLAAGFWRLAAGLAAGFWQLAAGGWRLASELVRLRRSAG